MTCVFLDRSVRAAQRYRPGQAFVQRGFGTGCPRNRMEPTMAIKTTEARKRLEERKADLLSLSDISSDSRDTVALDQQSVGRLSRMDAMQQQKMAEATERQRSAELQRIEAALVRLDDGEYGYCERCGEEIPDKRLAIDPSVGTCVACAG